MIIVINPMLSNTQVNSDSNYVYLRELLPEVIRLRPDWIFFMFWPGGSDWKYYDDGFFRETASNLIRVPKKWQPGKYRAGCDYDVDFFYSWFARNPYDIIWNNTVEQTPVFWNLRTQSSETFRPLIVNYHHFPVHKTLPGINDNYYGVQGLQAIGTALVDVNVFNSKWCQKMSRDVNEIFLNQTQLNRIEKSSVLNYMGPIKEDFPETQSYDRPVFIYNHRIAGYKNWDVTFDMFDRLHREGLIFKVIVTSVDTQSVTRVSNRPYAEVVNCFTREQYLAQLKRANINVSNSQHETFCISMVESMAAGHVPVGPNRCTFPELFEDKKSGFIFYGDDDQIVIMRELVTNQAMREKYGQAAKIRAREMFSATRYAKHSVEIFEKLYNTMEMPNTSKLVEMEKSIKGLPSAMEFMPAYRRVQTGLGWMNQAFPIKYFSFVARHFGLKFTVKNQQVWVINPHAK